MRNLPHMAIKIGPIAGISAPEYLLRRFQRARTHRYRCLIGGIHPRAVGKVLRQCHRPGAQGSARPPLILGQIIQPEQPQSQSIHLEKRNTTGFRSGYPAQRAVKSPRPVQIGHPQCHQSHPL